MDALLLVRLAYVTLARDDSGASRRAIMRDESPSGRRLKELPLAVEVGVSRIQTATEPLEWHQPVVDWLAYLDKDETEHLVRRRVEHVPSNVGEAMRTMRAAADVRMERATT